MIEYKQHAELMSNIDRIQRQLADLNGRLRRMPLVLQTQDGNIKKQTVKLDDLKKEHQKLLLHAKGKEKELNTSEQALAKRRVQLGEAKTNKEFLALKSLIETDETASSVLADAALAALEEAEAFLPSVKSAEEELKKSNAQHNTTKEQYAAEKPIIQADIERCTGMLKESEKLLNSDFQDAYKRLVASHGGSESLSLIEKQNFCGGCNQQVAINTISLVLQLKPICCQSCGRLLYLPDDYKFDKG